MSLLTPNPQSSSPEHRLLIPAGVMKHLHVVVHAVPDDATAYADIQALKDRLQSENVVLREEIDQTSMFEEIVGASPPLRAVLSHVSKVAPTDSTVLITGETGTGKELIARAIHKRSPRATRAFVAVNCAAIPSSLIASELFGHEKGAFTGALQRRQGRFELADGGTLFLDEVAELPAETQIMLLRVLQEREFERVGGSGPVRVNVRVIAATNRDLHAAVADGSFRADLFYRLNVFPLDVPPLRDRRPDVPLLVEYFTHRYAQRLGKRVRRVTPATSTLLQAYDWPGNIRELQNVIERAVILCESDTLAIDPRWLAGRSPGPAPVASLSTGTLAAHEQDAIEAALTHSKGRVAGPFGAAGRLGVPASTLESKIKALHIDKRRFKSA
jgi:transcriptional regulator with GAF, ATPase, and Fis domain